MLEEISNGEPSDVTGGAEVSLSRAEIQERMSGNLCRCGAYSNIVDAILESGSGQPLAHEVTES
jgi:xanthine dehydrogenase YagT iron-sulfur-binding subunit